MKIFFYIISLTVLLFSFNCNIKKNNITNQLNSCKNITYTDSENINKLRPNNIDIIMALGDSITAGFGLEGFTGLYNEYRGRSWSIGGDDGQLTLPNIIKYFNPNLKGYSIGNHSAEVCLNKGCKTKYYKNDYYNAAQSGAKTNNLIYQINHLEKIMRSTSHEENDYLNKWKLITILIGSNDLCGICLRNNVNLMEYRDDLSKALILLKEKFPKSIVNMMLIFNVSQVYDVSRKSIYCKDFHTIMFEECLCTFSPIYGKKFRDTIDLYAEQYRKITKEVVDEINSNKYPNFKIIVQPTLAMTNFSKFTVDFLSNLDCFHPSLIAHQSLAVALWNNLFLKEKKSVEEYPRLYCPTNNSYIEII